jgi:hypothetical protein
MHCQQGFGVACKILYQWSFRLDQGKILESFIRGKILPNFTKNLAIRSERTLKGKERNYDHEMEVDFHSLEAIDSYSPSSYGID